MKKTLAIVLAILMILQMLSLFVAPISGQRLNTKKERELVSQFHDERLNNLIEKYKDIVPGEIIVKFKHGIGENKIRSMNSLHGLSQAYRSPFSGFHRLKIPIGKSVEQMVDIYSKSPLVEYVEPNYIARICMTPNDPYYSYQWHLHDVDEGGIDMEPAWDISTGSGVTVAVIDTGIREGTDLADTCFVAGYDFVNNDNDPIDDNGHGTHVAGTIAQSTNNNVGVAGVAYDACLMPVKVLDAYGYGTYADIMDGINYATDNGANIISMSLGGSSPSQGMEDALEDAYNAGITCVAASGNDNQNGILYPAAYDDYVIAVGATQYNKKRAPYSNYGSSLDVVAPGGNLNLDQNGDGYGDGVLQQTFRRVWWWIQWGYYFYQGTSMATPHVSGTAALLYSDGVTSPDDIREALEFTALDLGDSGWDMYYGHGLINAYDALQYNSDSPPTCTITAPIDGATVSGDVTIEVSTTDDNGVVEAKFYVDDVYLGKDTSEPYSWIWDSTSVGDGTHTIKATAVDTASQETSDSIDVTVDNTNDPPIADAGPDQTVTDLNGDNYESVDLDGSNSYDPDGSITAYEWTEGATVLGSAAIITYDFSVGTHTVTLTVTDNEGATDSDECIINVVANQDPVADAGPDQTANDADGNNVESFTLDGSNSYDPDGSITAYEWTEGATVLGTDEIITYDFTVGIHTVTLTVTDDGGATDTDECIINVVANQDPVVDAGPDQSGYVDDTFTFDGSGSSDPDGSIVSYYWDFNDGSDAYGEIVTHTYTTAETYIVTLTVTDNGGLTDSDQATVTAEETQSETEEFFDSFEVSEWNGLWVEDSQNDWFRSTHRSSHGSYAAEVDGRANDATLTMTDPIDLSGKSTATLTYSWFIERNWDKGEYIALDVYDGSWHEVKKLKGNEDPENTWHHETIDLSSYMASNFKIRFRAKVSRSSEDGHVDNVKIVSYS